MRYQSCSNDEIYDEFDSQLSRLLTVAKNDSDCDQLIQSLEKALNDPQVDYSTQLFQFVASELINVEHPCKSGILKWVISLITQDPDSDISMMACISFFNLIVGNYFDDTECLDTFLSLCDSERTLETVFESYADEEKIEELPNFYSQYQQRKAEQGLSTVPFPYKAYQAYKTWLQKQLAEEE